jgi:hypothetical protein
LDKDRTDRVLANNWDKNRECVDRLQTLKHYADREDFSES